jgi:hypothetical protein
MRLEAWLSLKGDLQQMILDHSRCCEDHLAAEVRKDRDSHYPEVRLSRLFYLRGMGPNQRDRFAEVDRRRRFRLSFGQLRVQFHGLLGLSYNKIFSRDVDSQGARK